jgi:hypothetical protein
MKTNFEKWKENLKPEGLIAARAFGSGYVAIWCECCPAKKNGKCLVRGDQKGFVCQAPTLLKWLNQPAEEDK